MPFVEASEALTHSPFPGVEGRIVHGDGMTLAFWHIPAGTDIPEHEHLHEQFLHVVSGTIDATVGGEVRRLEAGDTAVLPSHVPHGVHVVTDAHLIDVFRPARPEYGRPASGDGDRAERP